nr:hypothetical protein [Nannocystis sp.]
MVVVVRVRVRVVIGLVVAVGLCAAIALLGGGLELRVERADLGFEALDRLGVHPQRGRVVRGLERGFVTIALFLKALEPREGFLNPVFRGHT